MLAGRQYARGLGEDFVLAVAQAPEQRIYVRAGREIRQSRVAMPPDGTLYLVRVVVDVEQGRETVVTTYRTRRIEKYWSST